MSVGQELYAFLTKMVGGLILVIGFAVLPAFAASPREQLVGLWRFKRGSGGPCASQILSLEYSFHKDGRYGTKATMSGGAKYEYSGTYEATNNSATARVDGKIVGPYPYRIVDDVLFITDTQSRCEVQLEREDY